MTLADRYVENLNGYLNVLWKSWAALVSVFYCYFSFQIRIISRSRKALSLLSIDDVILPENIAELEASRIPLGHNLMKIVLQ